jgi:hypothetical protein
MNENTQVSLDLLSPVVAKGDTATSLDIIPNGPVAATTAMIISRKHDDVSS